MTNIYRPGSKLAEVYGVFLEQGIDAAIAHGNSIGLAASTLKIQVKRKNWGGDAPVAVPKAAKATTKPARTSAGDAKPKFRLTKGKRLFVVISEGPQQSICRWLDSGEEQ